MTSKIYAIVKYGMCNHTTVACFFNKEDAEELYADLVFEESYDKFHYYLKQVDPYHFFDEDLRDISDVVKAAKIQSCRETRYDIKTYTYFNFE